MKRFEIFPKIFTLLIFLSILQVCPFVKAESEGTDLIISLDSSGSMIEGMAFEAAKEAAKAQVAKLTTGDYISVLRFDQSTQTVLEQEITSSDQRDKVIKQIENLQPQGAWTNVSDALDATGRTLKRLQEKLPNYRHIVYVLTDGSVFYGPNQPVKQIDAVVREYWDNFANSDKIYKFYIYSLNWPANQEWMRFATSCRATISDKAMPALEARCLIKFSAKNLDFGNLVIYANNIQGAGTASAKLRLEEFRGGKTETLTLNTKNVDFPAEVNFSLQPSEIVCNGPSDYTLTLTLKGERKPIGSKDTSYSREFKLFFIPRGSGVEVLPKEGITCTINIVHSPIFDPTQPPGMPAPQPKIIFGKSIDFTPIKLGDEQTQATAKGILRIEKIEHISEQNVSLYLSLEGLPPGVTCKPQAPEIKVTGPGQREISVLFSGVPGKEGIYNLAGRLLPQVDDKNVIVSPKEIICQFKLESVLAPAQPTVWLEPRRFDLGEIKWVKKETRTFSNEIVLSVERLEQAASEQINLTLAKDELGDNLQAELRTKKIDCIKKGQKIPVVLSLSGKPPSRNYKGIIRLTPKREGLQLTPREIEFTFTTTGGEVPPLKKLWALLGNLFIFLVIIGTVVSIIAVFRRRKKSILVYARMENGDEEILRLYGSKPKVLDTLGFSNWYIRHDPAANADLLLGQIEAGQSVPARKEKPVRFDREVVLTKADSGQGFKVIFSLTSKRETHTTSGRGPELPPPDFE